MSIFYSFSNNTLSRFPSGLGGTPLSLGSYIPLHTPVDFLMGKNEFYLFSNSGIECVNALTFTLNRFIANTSHFSMALHYPLITEDCTYILLPWTANIEGSKGRIYSTATGELLHDLNHNGMAGQTIAPDNKAYMFSIDYSQYRCRVYDPVSNTSLLRPGLPGAISDWINSFAINRIDDTTLVVMYTQASTYYYYLYDLPSGTQELLTTGPFTQTRWHFLRVGEYIYFLERASGSNYTHISRIDPLTKIIDANIAPFTVGSRVLGYTRYVGTVSYGLGMNNQYVNFVDYSSLTGGVLPINVRVDDVAESFRLTGVIRDASNAPAQRRVSFYHPTTGAHVGTTLSDPITGEYSLRFSENYGELTRVVYSGDANRNDIIDRFIVS